PNLRDAAGSEWFTRETLDGIVAGIRWVVALQNRDSGWPTFCKGWGYLPFDRSGVDLTAHALRAIASWQSHIHHDPEHGWDKAWEIYGLDANFDFDYRPVLAYLARNQRPDGSWLPLWFGNQHTP